MVYDKIHHKPILRRKRLDIVPGPQSRVHGLIVNNGISSVRGAWKKREQMNTRHSIFHMVVQKTTKGAQGLFSLFLNCVGIGNEKRILFVEYKLVPVFSPFPQDCLIPRIFIHKAFKALTGCGCLPLREKTIQNFFYLFQGIY